MDTMHNKIFRIHSFYFFGRTPSEMWFEAIWFAQFELLLHHTSI